MERPRAARRPKKIEWGEYLISLESIFAHYYYRLSARWPQRYNRETFGDIPLSEIRQSYKADLQLRALEGTPAAEAAAATYRVHNVKSVHPRMFNPAAAALYSMEAKEAIPTRAAQTFLQLLEAGKLPSWINQSIDLDFIKAAANG